MKYLIVQNWNSTNGNHAGMKHMCELLIKRYPQKYTLITNETFQCRWLPDNKILRYPFLIYQRFYQRYFSTFKYKRICKNMFNSLSEGDEVFLLEYLFPAIPQYGLAVYIRRQFPKVKIYALSHLTPTIYKKIFQKPYKTMYKWSLPIDKMLTLGSSLSTFFIEEVHIPKEKVSTGLHYADLNYYQNSSIKKVNAPMTIIVMGNVERNYELLSKIVHKISNIKWVICKGHAQIDHYFSNTPNVQLKGYIAEDELRNIMKNADISLNVMNDTVGSNVITTSMAMGLAIITSNVGSIHDYCSEENAVFCDNNEESFINAINYLIANPSKVESMKKSSIEISKKLDIEYINQWFSNL